MFKKKSQVEEAKLDENVLTSDEVVEGTITEQEKSVEDVDKLAETKEEQKQNEKKPEPKLSTSKSEDKRQAIQKSTEKKSETLTGRFKIYRGRNINTITSLTSTVVTDGDIIEEDGVRWQPVKYNGRTGVEATGYIIVR